MPNKFYQTGEQRAAKVGDLFATVAPRYDLINDLQSFGLHRRWKAKMVGLADPKAGERALDLCCGTGDVALRLARAGARVTGLDFSPAMLAQAGERALAARPHFPETGSVEFIREDAQHLASSDDAFDIVTISYGLRNLTSWERGLEEMLRVAKPGGRLLVLDFGKPENRLWRSFYFGYLRSFVPLFGGIFCGDAATHAYIYESLQHYPAQRGVSEKLRRMGCTSVRTINLVGGAMSITYAKKPGSAT